MYIIRPGTDLHVLLLHGREEEQMLREQAAREKRRNEEEREFLERKLEEERRRRAKAESESAAEIARLQRELDALRPNKVKPARSIVAAVRHNTL